MNRRQKKATIYPSMQIDEGMINLMLLHEKFRNIIYLKGTLKSFYAEDIQKINSGNYEIMHMILDIRDTQVRKKILKHMRNGSSYLIFGTENVTKYKNSRSKMTIKENIVCLYVPELHFYPGISWNSTYYKAINKKAS